MTVIRVFSIGLIGFALAACANIPHRHGLAAGGARPEGDISRLYVFGDSYSDIGAGYVDGNGPTAVAYAAEELALPITFWGSEEAGPNSSLVFAVSGARSGNGVGFYIARAQTENGPHRRRMALLGRGLTQQAASFAAAAQARTVRFDPSTSVFLIAIGLNDASLSTDDTQGNIASAVRILFTAGARCFAIATLPEAVPAFAAVAQRLNPMLRSVPQTFSPQYPDAIFLTSDWGGFFDDVLGSASQYGFTESVRPCVPGREIFGEDATECTDPDRYYYFHPWHPSTAVHRIVGAMLAEELRGQMPCT